ncbi:hypothetical protein BLX06_15585 [Bacillus cereus]|uniref:Crystaline entomocidal protoxin n=1 Tax=Bacillus cereus TaxID=1396 RepID=A0A9X6B845_BACCE|nr:hypothetical protein BLX06_15585 [Bacillus cereus]
MVILQDIYKGPYNVLAISPLQNADVPVSNYDELIEDLQTELFLGRSERAIASILERIADNKINYQTIVMMSLGLASFAVPALGLLTPFVGLFFSLLNPGPEPPTVEDIFKAMQPAIQDMIDRSLTQTELNQMNNHSDALQKQLGIYKDAMEHFYSLTNPTDIQANDLHNQIDYTNNVLQTGLSFFKTKEYEVLGLPYYTMFATISLLLLSDKVKHGLSWKYSSDDIPFFEGQFNAATQEYSSQIVKIMQTMTREQVESIDFYQNVTGFMSTWPGISPINYKMKNNLDNTQTFKYKVYNPNPGDPPITEYKMFDRTPIAQLKSVPCTNNKTFVTAIDTINNSYGLGMVDFNTYAWYLQPTDPSACAQTYTIDPMLPLLAEWSRYFSNPDSFDPGQPPIGRAFAFWTNPTTIPDGIFFFPYIDNLLYIGEPGFGNNVIHNGMKISQINSFFNFNFVNILTVPENISNDANSILSIPAEKYSLINGWKSVLEANLNYPNEAVTGSTPLISTAVNQDLAFNVINLLPPNGSWTQYKLRVHYATDADGAELSVINYGYNAQYYPTQSSIKLPNTVTLSNQQPSDVQENILLSYPSTKGLLGTYMISTDTIPINFGQGKCQFTLRNTGGKKIILDRIELIPVENPNAPGPIVDRIPDQFFPGTPAPPSIWKNTNVMAVRAELDLYPLPPEWLGGYVVDFLLKNVSQSTQQAQDGQFLYDPVPQGFDEIKIHEREWPETFLLDVSVSGTIYGPKQSV